MKRIAIVGCGFAGLITGYYITKHCRNRVSLEFFDRKKRIGEGQTSACATPVKIINELGLESSTLKKVNRFNAVVGSVEYSVKVPYYATFDYRIFCKELKSKIKGKFRLGKRINPRAIKLDFDLVIDASGWSSPIEKNKNLSFALETVIDIEGPDSGALNMYIGKNFVDGGYCWAFPVSDTKFRVGVGSYKKLNFPKELKRFVKTYFRVDVDKIHGGYIPVGMTDKLTEENIICVGDSAAHTLPISYEGIRPAFFFSKALASMVSDFSKNKLSLQQLKEKYEDLNRNKKLLYRIALHTQNLMTTSGSFITVSIMKILFRSPMSNKLMKTYFEFV